MNKRILIIVIFICILFIGCQRSNLNNNKQYSENVELKSSDIEEGDFPWNIKIESYAIKETLASTGSNILYNGVTQETSYNDIPENGNIFLLLNLTIEKTQTGNSSFDWENLVVVDKNFSEYNRHIDDSFLSNHQYERIPSTSFKMGINSGWACFEVKDISAQNELSLLYKLDDDSYRIKIK